MPNPFDEMLRKKRDNPFDLMARARPAVRTPGQYEQPIGPEAPPEPEVAPQPAPPPQPDVVEDPLLRMRLDAIDEQAALQRRHEQERERIAAGEPVQQVRPSAALEMRSQKYRSLAEPELENVARRGGIMEQIKAVAKRGGISEERLQEIMDYGRMSAERTDRGFLDELGRARYSMTPEEREVLDLAAQYNRAPEAGILTGIPRGLRSIGNVATGLIEGAGEMLMPHQPGRPEESAWGRVRQRKGAEDVVATAQPLTTLGQTGQIGAEMAAGFVPGAGQAYWFSRGAFDIVPALQERGVPADKAALYGMAASAVSSALEKAGFESLFGGGRATSGILNRLLQTGLGTLSESTTEGMQAFSDSLFQSFAEEASNLPTPGEQERYRQAAGQAVDAFVQSLGPSAILGGGMQASSLRAADFQQQPRSYGVLEGPAELPAATADRAISRARARRGDEDVPIPAQQAAMAVANARERQAFEGINRAALAGQQATMDAFHDADLRQAADERAGQIAQGDAIKQQMDLERDQQLVAKGDEAFIRLAQQGDTQGARIMREEVERARQRLAALQMPQDARTQPAEAPRTQEQIQPVSEAPRPVLEAPELPTIRARTAGDIADATNREIPDLVPTPESVYDPRYEPWQRQKAAAAEIRESIPPKERPARAPEYQPTPEEVRQYEQASPEERARGELQQDLPTQQPSLKEVASRAPRAISGRVWITDAYQEARKDRPDLTLDQYKQELLDAQQRGEVTLSRADSLGTKPGNEQKMADSTTKHRTANAEFQLITVPETAEESQEQTRQQIAEMRRPPMLRPEAAGGLAPPADLPSAPTSEEIRGEQPATMEAELPTQPSTAQTAKEKAQRDIETRLSVQTPSETIGKYGTPIKAGIVERAARSILKLPGVKKAAVALDTVRNMAGAYLKRMLPGLRSTQDKLVDAERDVGRETVSQYRQAKSAMQPAYEEALKELERYADAVVRIARTPEQREAMFRAASGLTPAQLKSRIRENQRQAKDLRQDVARMQADLTKGGAQGPQIPDDVTAVKPTDRGGEGYDPFAEVELKPTTSAEQRKSWSKERGKLTRAIEKAKARLRELEQDTKDAVAMLPQAKTDWETIGGIKGGRWALEEHHRRSFELGSKAVQYGFMTEETLRKHVNEYIRMAYERDGKLLGGLNSEKLAKAFQKAFGAIMARSGTWKHRKYAMTPEGQLKAQKRGLKLVQDFVYASVTGQAQELRDVAVGKFFQEGVIDTGLAVPEESDAPPGWVKLRGATAKKYGKLAKYKLHPAVAEDIEGMLGANESSVSSHPAFKWLHQQLKRTMVTRNPASHVRQLLSNFGPGIVQPFSFMDLLDVPYSQIPTAYKMMRDKDELWQEFEKTDLPGGGAVPQLISQTKDISTPEQFVEVIAQLRKGEKAGALRKLDDFASDAYQFPDMFVKFLGYQNYRRQGFSKADAARMTTERTPNYQLVPAAIKRWEKHALGAPFMSFWYDSMRIFLNNISTPRGVIKYGKFLALQQAMSAWMQSATGYDEEDEETLRRSRYLTTFAMPIPVKLADDSLLFWDPGRTTAAGDMGVLLQTLLVGGEGETWDQIKEVVDDRVLSAILLQDLFEVSLNKDKFTGREIYKENEQWYRKGTKAISHIASPFVPGSFKYTARDLLRKLFETPDPEYGDQPTTSQILARRFAGAPIDKSYPLEKSQERMEDRKEKRRPPEGQKALWREVIGIRGE